MSLDHKASFVKPSNISFDEFLGGKLVIEQPKKGFRSGNDAILLGASITNGRGKLLELGAGVGVASLCALKNNDNLTATLIDNNPFMVELANKNIKNNNLQERAKSYEFDIANIKNLYQGKQKISINYYDYVLANPPYFVSENSTKSQKKERNNARLMKQGEIEKWVKFGAATLKQRGKIIFIFNTQNLISLLQALEKSFGNIIILPIVSRKNLAAKRVLISAIKGSRTPLELKSPLIIHKKQGGQYRKKIEKILRGEEILHW